jgi:hypothetical protein
MFQRIARHTSIHRLKSRIALYKSSLSHYLTIVYFWLRRSPGRNTEPLVYACYSGREPQTQMNTVKAGIFHTGPWQQAEAWARAKKALKDDLHHLFLPPFPNSKEADSA